MLRSIAYTCCLWLLITFTSHGASNTSPFVPGSFETIVNAKKQRSFLLILWSLDCPPCRKELQMLGEARHENPGLDLVFISTDDISRVEETQTMLKEFNLEGIESWIFAEPNSMQLRFEVDPSWYGELPRAYFYSPDKQRNGFSGPLKPAQIEDWLKAIPQSSL